jgi:hypothetical protein
MLGSAQASKRGGAAALRYPPAPIANPEPQWELGIRYWWSQGKTRFDINSSRQNRPSRQSHLVAHL